MKTRKVFVTLELETDIPIGELRSAIFWETATRHISPVAKLKVLQAQANVVKKDKKEKSDA